MQRQYRAANSFSGREAAPRQAVPGTGRGGIYTDFEYRLDLSIAPALGFEPQLAAMPDGVDAAGAFDTAHRTRTGIARPGCVPGQVERRLCRFLGFCGAAQIHGARYDTARRGAGRG